MGTNTDAATAVAGHGADRSIGDGQIGIEQAAFRAELLERGLLVETGLAGSYGRSDTFERIVAGISGLVSDAGAGDGPTTSLTLPMIMPRTLLARMNYLASFPQLAGSVHSFTGTAREHAELVASAAAGADWGAALSSTDAVLCPAACHMIYPMCGGEVPEQGRRFDVVGHCFRSEPSDDPARMQSFRQHEHVFVGTAEHALAHRDRWVVRAAEILDDLDVPVVTDAANDPFFGRLSGVLAAGQRAKELKYEILGTTSSARLPTALVSANHHEDHFGAVFGIATPDGETAHTACVGFGLERVTLALLARHGPDPAGWPAHVRAALALA